jgi:type III restriction enzyme
MKFKFSKNLEYQLDAVNAVVGIFDGGNGALEGDGSFSLRAAGIVGNELGISGGRIVQNLRSVQEQNGIAPVSEKLESMDFSVEMETGTGKTYVYLRTVLELHKKYGLTKFIILVPSVAIREGVLKTIEQTDEHFSLMYGVHLKRHAFVYDSGKLSGVREFARSPYLQIMIMTIQSFNGDTKIMKQTPDRFHGERPIDMVAETRPVVIMDEPQNMESELSKSAIEELKPLAKLRYSATHKNIHNLVYRLSPVDAYVNGLVKKVEVYGAETDIAGDFIFKLKEVVTKKGESPKARVLFEVKNTDGTYAKKEALLKAGDDVFVKSKKNQKYAELFVREIDARSGVELSNGEVYSAAADVFENKEALFRSQIRETIKSHMRKQAELGGRIKVLSLFFIDEVKNYRGDDALIKRIFEEEFEAIKNRYEHFKEKEVGMVHDGYFSQDREKENRRSSDVGTVGKREKLTFDLIMKNKEQLLSFSEPISFIFSHSALKEGWDNPNIFQICTLIETKDDFTKRQKIGRGLRLPVDVNGDRVHDSKINVLTVVANESYQDFAESLQKEYADAGYAGVPKPENGRGRISIKTTKMLLDEDFKKLWEVIRQKTVYNVALDTERLVRDSVERINNEISSGNIAVVINKAQIAIDKNGKVKTIYQNQSVGEALQHGVKIGNVIERVAKETELTRQTVFAILSSVSNSRFLFENPEDYMRSTVEIIRGGKSDLMINDGLQYVPTKNAWSMELFIDFKGYENSVIASEKSIYDHVLFDSEGEREFAESLEQDGTIKLFAKLPGWFTVDTPLGEYNPDWAIVKDDGEGQKLYLVRETKFGGENQTAREILANLRPSESGKIKCAEKHFKTIGADFALATKKDLSDLRN